jgi:hypothetical protein
VCRSKKNNDEFITEQPLFVLPVRGSSTNSPLSYSRNGGQECCHLFATVEKVECVFVEWRWNSARCDGRCLTCCSKSGSARRWRASVGGPPTERDGARGLKRTAGHYARWLARNAAAAGRRVRHAGDVRSPTLNTADFGATGTEIAPENSVRNAAHPFAP